MALNLSKELRKLVQGVSDHPQVGLIAFTLGARNKDGQHTGSGVFLKIDPSAGEQKVVLAALIGSVIAVLARIVEDTGIASDGAGFILKTLSEVQRS